MADDPGSKAFCNGLTETLTAKLTQLTGSYPLQVVPTSEIRTEGVTSVEQARKPLAWAWSWKEVCTATAARFA